MTSRYLVALLSVTSVCAQTGPNTSKVIETYCSGCHNGGMRSPSGVLLDQFSEEANPEVWSRAYRQLQAGTMPPVGAPRPDRATYGAVLASLEQSLGVDAKPAAITGSQEIATRLATLLWNSAPDAALLQDAQRNRLNDPSTLERQVRRMLADDRAQAFISRFFVPWLQINQLEKVNNDTTLRDALVKETELFLLSQLRDDRDPLELWTANYTFLNEPLANHYGVSGVRGIEFRRVASTPERAGLLGQGSILMVTSHRDGPQAAYSSPATRGVWIRRHFLGVNPPNPFPGAQPLKPELPITPQTRVLPNDPCVTCHRNFFPLGYALENFDPQGRWRTHDQVGPVDASGVFVDGASTNGVVELRKVLLQRPDAFRTAITERLLVFAATGKAAPINGTPDTLIQARQILRDMKEPRWSAMIAAIVRTN